MSVYRRAFASSTMPLSMRPRATFFTGRWWAPPPGIEQRPAACGPEGQPPAAVL